MKCSVIINAQNTRKWSSKRKAFVRELSVGARHKRWNFELTMEWSG